ncbi:DegT/DnrJ/EryC1/StrS family aminotransferase [Edaphobacter modestus]|uniref:dTDP-4-amino-4,6-dideoxygalactose transaminase n=1 Tax=Edaphobacter modestus TaxID=388466 RepID=A0A4Q7YQ64_9BACT|nr:DegT/DnrJ/EryC1/StrS family aminotransferase [Edaphobacter modestus]RZU38909.1 dTDP-4-amino-4,6-dideoxygalactose transaminase [Edaphobacter modestus]
MISHISAQRDLQASVECSFANFPFLDLKAQFAEIRNDLVTAVTGVLESQHFILGPEVEALEREVAEYVGAEFAIGCGSGSDALLLAQMALGIEPDDEIITSPFTFGATAGSIARLRARPVFVDIHPETFNIDERKLEAAITPRSRAIMPIHLFGLPANMDAVLEIARKHHLAVIEDAAQAIGARWKQKYVGSLGTFGCFSFFPSKNLGGAGDGGLVTTNDQQLAQRLRILRVHGTGKKYHYDLLGINSRLDALQAAILRVKLHHLNKWTHQRRRNADRYRDLFMEYDLTKWLVLPCSQETSFHVYNQYSIRAPRRDDLQIYLRDHGIPTEVYYPSPLHVEPAFAYLGHGPGDFPNAEQACQEALSLPIYPELTFDQQRAVVMTISQFYQRETSNISTE